MNSREDADCRKRPREAPECAKAYSFYAIENRKYSGDKESKDGGKNKMDAKTDITVKLL